MITDTTNARVGQSMMGHRAWRPRAQWLSEEFWYRNDERIALLTDQRPVPNPVNRETIVRIAGEQARMAIEQLRISDC